MAFQNNQSKTGLVMSQCKTTDDFLFIYFFFQNDDVEVVNTNRDTDRSTSSAAPSRDVQ